MFWNTLGRWLVPAQTTQTRGLPVLRVEHLEDRTVPYAIGLEGANPVHEYLTQQAYALFEKQFGNSDLLSDGGYLTYLMDGAHDEDVEAPDSSGQASNPFGEQGLLNHPSYRHFWAHMQDYSRRIDDGLVGFDSAPNRSVEYFTGGVGVDGLNPEWGGGQGAIPGEGIKVAYDQGAKILAYNWLGHVAHLLQDMTVPAHVHADPHLEASKISDFDPYHDYVDGVQMSTSGIDRGGFKYISSFNDPASPRFMVFASIDGMSGQSLRSPSAIQGPYTTYGTSNALFNLFRGNADKAVAFDTKDYVGAANPKMVGAADRGTTILIST